MDDKIPKEFRDLLDTSPLSKNLLLVEQTKLNIKLTNKTLKKLKWDDFMHILFLIIGGFISFFFTNVLGADNHKETTTEIHKLQTEISVLKSDFQIRLNEQQIIISDLQNQLNNREKSEKP